MYIILCRSRAPKAPFQMNISEVFPNREEAETKANGWARANTGYDYVVFEAQSQHSARIEVDVKKP